MLKLGKLFGNSPGDKCASASESISCAELADLRGQVKAIGRSSVAKIADGSRLVEQSGKSLSNIVSSVKKVTDIVGEISVASADQAAGIEQVSRAVSSMDEGTQQNAALVEQAAAASESIVQQVRELNAATGRQVWSRRA